MKKTTYTTAELSTLTSLTDLPGRAITGAPGVRYKRVRLAEGEDYAEAIVAQYGDDTPVVIQEPAKRDQFLHRGC